MRAYTKGLKRSLHLTSLTHDGLGGIDHKGPRVGKLSQQSAVVAVISHSPGLRVQFYNLSVLISDRISIGADFEHPHHEGVEIYVI